MPAINLRIVRVGDHPPWADIAAGVDYVHLDEAALTVAVLENGMTTGQPAVALRIDLPDGQVVIVENSLAAWIAATSGMRGAFPGAFAGGPLEAPPPS